MGNPWFPYIYIYYFYKKITKPPKTPFRALFSRGYDLGIALVVQEMAPKTLKCPDRPTNGVLALSCAPRAPPRPQGVENR